MKAGRSSDDEILQIHGYHDEAMNHYFLAIEKRGGDQWLRKYQLDEEALKIYKIQEIRIDGDEVTSVDIDDRYVALGYGYFDRSKGKIEVRRLDSLERVHDLVGNSANYNIGLNVQIVSEKLQPGNHEVHYVYYNSVRRASSRLNRFYIGQLAIIH